MAGRVSSHVRANLVAYLALFFSITGSASALVVTGELVKDDSLTGADVVESSLGEVPRAAAAGNADKLGGEDAGAFARMKSATGSTRLREVMQPVADMAVETGRTHVAAGRVTIQNDAFNDVTVACELVDAGITLATGQAVVETGRVGEIPLTGVLAARDNGGGSAAIHCQRRDDAGEIRGITHAHGTLGIVVGS